MDREKRYNVVCYMGKDWHDFRTIDKSQNSLIIKSEVARRGDFALFLFAGLETLLRFCQESGVGNITRILCQAPKLKKMHLSRKLYIFRDKTLFDAKTYN